MDVQQLIGEVARRHNVLVDPGDPIFVAVTLNELLLAEHLEEVQVALLQANTAILAASRKQTEEARQLAEQLITGAAKDVREQVREAGDKLRRHLDQLIEGYLASARAAARESSRCSTASFWAAAIAVACMCTSAAIAVIAWS